MSSAISQNLKMNLFKISTPMTGEVVKNSRLTADSRGVWNDVRHIVIRYSDDYPYVPGQSAGILPPGEDTNILLLEEKFNFLRATRRPTIHGLPRPTEIDYLNFGHSGSIMQGTCKKQAFRFLKKWAF